ncbi:MAG: alcohol dehydrogenase catalytic domain-containing protein [Candidatus Gastranaerophilales bacterium]|nr:alcohol dehydrogenase catalytic domain-containing protein [Candidatus Gastranaerophilales bacterium]
MLASVLHNDKFVVEEVDKPVLTDNGAIIKVIGCGLCGSDIVKYTHKLSKDGAVLGHEVVGKIVEIKGNSDFKVGDMVVAAHHYPCFECNYCRHGNYSMCRSFKNTNIIPGGFSEYIKVDEGHLKYTVFKIPENLDLITASFTEPLSCCYRAVRRMELLKGDRVGIVGLGSIGILMGQAAKTFDTKIIGLDIKDERLKVAKEHNFDEVYNSMNLDKSLELDAIFLTAGADLSVKTALEQIRDGGKICVFASTKSDTPCFPNNEVYYRELTVYGSYSPAPSDLKKSFELLKDKKINVENMTEIYNFDKLNEAIADTLSGKIMKAFIKVGE